MNTKNIKSQKVIEWRKALKEKGWKQVNMLVPDPEMVERLLRYRWLMMKNFKRTTLEKQECD